MENEALKEVGRGLIAFANLLTALYLINVVLHVQEYVWLHIIGAVYTFATIYHYGYLFIRKGTKNGNV